MVTLDGVYSAVDSNTDQVDVGSVVVTASDDRLLVVGVAFNNDDYGTPDAPVLRSGSSDVATFTAIGSAVSDDDTHVSMWALVNPATGTYTVRSEISATQTTGGDNLYGVVVWSISDADQVNPIRDHDGEAVPDVDSWSGTVTTEADDLVLAIGFMESGDDTGDFDTGAGLTQDVRLVDAAVSPDAAIGAHAVATGVSFTATMTAVVSDENGGVYVVSVAPSGGGEPPVPPLSGVMTPTHQTQIDTDTGDDYADDPAIFWDPSDPSNSVVFCAYKGSSGGVGVHDLTGSRVDRVGSYPINNVVHYDFRGTGEFGDQILVAGARRDTNVIQFFWYDEVTQTLSTAGSDAVGFEPYGQAIYVSPVDGDVFIFVSEATNGSNQLDQVQLSYNSGGNTVTGSVVRSLDPPDLVDGIVCDDQNERVFVGLENTSIRVYGAEPGDGTSFTTLDTAGGGNLVADIEGLTIYRPRSGGDTYLVVSSQGDSSFHVYDLEPPYAHRARFTIGSGSGIDTVADTDGIDISARYFNEDYPDGLLVVHDGSFSGTSNYKYLDAAQIFGSLPVFQPMLRLGGETPIDYRIGTQQVIRLCLGSTVLWEKEPAEGTVIPSVVGSTSWTTDDSQAFTVALPSDSEGYLAVASYHGTDSDPETALLAPSGWTLLASGNGDQWSTYGIWYANTEDSPGTSWDYDRSRGGGSDGSGCVVVVTGYDRGIEPNAIATSAVSQSTVLSNPDITTDDATVVVRVLTNQPYGGTYDLDYPSSATDGRYWDVAENGSDGWLVAVAHETQETPGATGTETYVMTGTADSYYPFSFTIAFKEA